MKIMLIGDIIGEIGVEKVKNILPEYKKNNNIDFVIANGENSDQRYGNKF